MLKNNLNNKLESIIELYTKKYNEYRSQDLIGLYDGRAGTLFLQYLIYNYNKDLNVKVELTKNINILMETLRYSETLHCELSTGLGGIGYVFDIINEDPNLDIDLSDFLIEVDEALIDAVKNFIKNKNHDILHGLLGLGLYFLRRGKFKIVESIINELHNSSIIKDNCIAWNRYDDFIINENIYDFGLAHGVSGIIYFLGKCYKNDIQKDLCKKLITGSVAFIV
jgi:lantibiotic modifying enzyme